LAGMGRLMWQRFGVNGSGLFQSLDVPGRAMLIIQRFDVITFVQVIHARAPDYARNFAANDAMAFPYLIMFNASALVLPPGFVHLQLLAPNPYIFLLVRLH